MQAKRCIADWFERIHLRPLLKTNKVDLLFLAEARIPNGFLEALFSSDRWLVFRLVKLSTLKLRSSCKMGDDDVDRDSKFFGDTPLETIGHRGSVYFAITEFGDEHSVRMKARRQISKCGAVECGEWVCRRFRLGWYAFRPYRKAAAYSG